MTVLSLTEQSAIQDLLREQVAAASEGTTLEFHASWAARALNWPVARVRSALVWLAHPPTGDPWLKTCMRIRCTEHDRILTDVQEGEDPPEEFQCDDEDGWLDAERVSREVYFRPAPALIEHSKKNLAVR